MSRRPLFQSRGLAVAVGVAAFLVGWAAFYDAYEGRGRKTPLALRPFAWW